MYPVLDQMSALVSLCREDPEVRAALPAASPLGGGPLEPVLFGLLDLGIALEHRPEDRPRLAALGVDELLGQQQVVIKSLEQNFQKTDGVAGATILGDGRVALILDVPGLVALARAPRRAARTSPALAAVES